MSVTGTTAAPKAAPAPAQTGSQGSDFELPPKDEPAPPPATAPLVAQKPADPKPAADAKPASATGAYAGVSASHTTTHNVTELASKRVLAGKENAGGAVKDKGGEVTPVSTKQIASTTSTSISAGAGYKPDPDAAGSASTPRGPLETAGRWATETMNAMGIKDVKVSAELTVGREDKGVQEWRSTKPGEVARYSEEIPIAVKAGLSAQVRNPLFAGSLGADLTAKVSTKEDAGTGRHRSGFEVAGSVKASHSQTGTLQTRNHATAKPQDGSRPADAPVENTSSVTVGAVGEQVKIQTLQALDPKAYDAITGEMDLSRVMPGALAAGTKVAAHVVAQGPGAIVQGALNTGRAMADGTEAAAGAIVDGGAYLAGNAMHQVRNGLGVPGGHEAGIAAVEGGRANRAAQEARTMDAGEMLGWASDRVGDFNNGVGALVDGTVGSMADAARLYATGDVVLGMDTQELKDAGYGSIAATQERLEAASSELNANPPFQAPSLPASPQEALQRITPR